MAAYLGASPTIAVVVLQSSIVISHNNTLLTVGQFIGYQSVAEALERNFYAGQMLGNKLTTGSRRWWAGALVNASFGPLNTESQAFTDKITTLCSYCDVAICIFGLGHPAKSRKWRSRLTATSG